MGGLARARHRRGCWIAVTGARCAVTVDGRAAAHARGGVGAAGRCGRGSGRPRAGCATYLAVSGGIAVEPVLGSRSTDTLAWVGPPRVVAGTELPVGPRRAAPASYDAPRPPRPGPAAGRPRAARSTGSPADALDRLCATSYTVTPASNRIGLRLDGPPLRAGPRR